MSIRNTVARTSLLLAALTAGATAAHAQVYKCPDASGRTVIQEVPCIDGQKIKVRPATGYDNPENARAAEQRAGRQGSNQAILAAIAAGRPEVGMSEANLDMALGSPNQRNRANYQGQLSEQWVYQRHDGTWYVYVQNGVVDAFQFQERGGSARRSERQCLNSMEIRNLETSASSVTISPERKRELQRQVAEAKACK